MKKGLKIGAMVLGAFVLLPVLALFILSQVHVQTVHQKAIDLINSELGEGIEFHDFSLSYLRHFPHVHLGIREVSVRDGSREVIRAGAIDVVLNVSTLWSDQITIERLVIRDGFFHSEIDSTGRKPVLFQKRDKPSSGKARTINLESQSIRVLNVLVYFGNQVKSNRTYVRIDEADLNLNLEDSVIALTGSLRGNLDSLISNNTVLFADQPVQGEEIGFLIGLRDGTKVLENGYILSHGLKLYPRFRMKTKDDGQNIELHISGDGAFDAFLELFEFHVGLDLSQTNPDAELRLAYNQYGFVNPFERPYSELDFQINNADFAGETLPYPLKNVLIAGNYNNGEDHSPETVQLELDTLHAEIGDSYVNARLKLTNLNDPDIDAHFASRVDLSDVVKPTGKISLAGTIEADLKLDGRISELRAMHLEGRQQAHGSIHVRDLELLLDEQKIRVQLLSGSTLLNNHIFEVTTLVGAYNESAFHFSGLFENLDQYLLSDQESLGGSFILSFDKLDLRSTDAGEPATEKSASAGINLKGMKLNLDVSGREILTDFGSIRDLHLTSDLTDRELKINTLDFSYQDGHLHGTADILYDQAGITGMDADLRGDFKSFDLNFLDQSGGRNNQRAKGSFSLPDFVNARLDLRAGQVVYREQSLQNFDLRATLKGEELTIDHLVMDAYGGHTNIHGGLRLAEDRLSEISVYGEISFQQVDIERILQDLRGRQSKTGDGKPGTFPAGLEADLKVFARDVSYKDAEIRNLSTRVLAGNENVGLKDFHADLPFGKLDMDVTVAGYQGEEPQMSGKVRLVIDTLSVDQLLELEALGIPSDPMLKGSAPGQAKGSSAGLPDHLDVDLEVSAALLTYENARVHNLDLVVTYAPRQVDVRRMSFVFAGGRVDVNGNMAQEADGTIPGYLYSNVDDLDVRALFRSFDNFGQDKFTADNSSGKVSWSSHYYFMLGRNMVPVRDRNFWIMNINLHEAEFDKVEPIEKTLFFVGHKARDKMLISSLDITTILYGDKLYIPDVLMNDNIANLDVFGEVDLDDRVLDLGLEISLSDLFFRSKSKRIAQTAEGEIDLEKDAKLYLNLTGPLDDHNLKLINRRKFTRYHDNLMKEIKKAEVEFRELQKQPQ